MQINLQFSALGLPLTARLCRFHQAKRLKELKGRKNESSFERSSKVVQTERKTKFLFEKYPPIGYKN